MNRRSVLAALGFAPVAAPVIAREAAAKAGVQGALAVGTHPVPSSAGSPVPAIGEYNHKKWLWDRVKEAMSQERANEIRREAMTGAVPHLDPDLASSRSLSLSAAIRLQRERNAVRRLTIEREGWLASFRKETGLDWMPDWSGKDAT